MTQVSVERGLEIWGERAREGAKKEFTSLHMKDTFMPVDINAVSTEDRKGALEPVFFLKEKRTGEIKGRLCADGSKQHTL